MSKYSIVKNYTTTEEVEPCNVYILDCSVILKNSKTSLNGHEFIFHRKLIDILTSSFHSDTSFVCYMHKEIPAKMIDEYARALNDQFIKETRLNVYCTMVVSDPYYSLLYDGFEKLHTLQNFKDVSFIGEHTTTHITQSYNRGFKKLLYFERKHKLLDIDVMKVASCMVNKIIKSTTENWDDVIRKINDMKNTMIVIIGPPGIGKTTFSEQLDGIKMRYIRTKIPNRKVRENVIVYLDDKSNDQNVIIDGENATVGERYTFINTCKYRNMKTLCVFFNYERRVCDHMTKYIYNESQCKEELKHSRGITRYYNRLQKPKYTEGIDEIIEVNSIPFNFKNRIF